MPRQQRNFRLSAEDIARLERLAQQYGLKQTAILALALQSLEQRGLPTSRTQHTQEREIMHD